MGAHFFIDQFKGYNTSAFRKDLIAGAIVGIIAIPLGMAFAIAVGVKPEYGIYTTIIAGTIVAIFGGSRFQIAGPTGAFVPILLGVTMQYGYENLLIAGFLAGVMLLLMGLFRLGSYIKFIPRSVTIGFTSGIAVIIFTGQVGNFLGLTDLQSHELFIHNVREIAGQAHAWNPYAVIIALISLAIIWLTPRLFPKVPGSFIAILVSTILAVVFFDGKLATIGSEFGGIPNTLPGIQLPQLTLDRIKMLIQPAFIIAALGAIESLLSCVVADGMSGTRHDSNRELVGQGLANIVAPIFGGIPATGALARTATNVKSGAVTALSGVIHSVVVLVVVVVFAPYAVHIPMSCLAAVLMLVAWNMNSKEEFVHILKTNTEDGVVLVTTFLLTIFTNLTVAVQVGLLLAFVLFVKNMSDLHEAEEVVPDHASRQRKLVAGEKMSGRDCPQISIFTVEGPLFFGAAQLFEQRLMNIINLKPKVLILRLGGVPLLDATGENYLSSIVRHFQAHKGVLLVAGIQEQPLEIVRNSGLFQVIGAENFYADTHEAIVAATKLINHDQCKFCRRFAFQECSGLSAEELAVASQTHREAVLTP
jgi:SulP family sulfate permease